MTTTLVILILVVVALAIAFSVTFQHRDYMMAAPATLRFDSPPLHRPVAFDVICRRVISRNVWSTFYVAMHSGTAASAKLRDELNRRLRTDAADYETRGAEATIEEGAEITIVPEAEGVTFNPPSIRLRWCEPWHITEFRMQVTSDAHWVAGSVSFLIGPILVADVPFTSTLGESADDSVRWSTTTPYRSVFVSYAHADTAIVDQLEKAYRAIGDSYLRDISFLRSGEQWSPAVLQAIPSADVFQLCWSDAARSSKHVEAEWRHAFALRRMQFIRPMYWKKPLPQPPAELEDLHFTYIPLDDAMSG